MTMPWCSEASEYLVLCTAPDDKKVVALAGAFKLTYEEEQLSLIHAYVHYLDGYNERADAWVRVEVYDAGIAVKGGEPFGDQVQYSLISECWDGSWDSWEDAEDVSPEDQAIFEELGASLMALAIDDDLDGPFMVPRPEVIAASRPAEIIGYDGESICHSGRFNRELLLGAISRSLPRNEMFFELPWDLNAARGPCPRTPQTTPPAYRYLLRFQRSACTADTDVSEWFERFCQTCDLNGIGAAVDEENDTILAAALGSWSLFELDTVFTRASRALDEELLVVDLDHGRCQFYYSGRLEDSETLDILSALDEGGLAAYETSYSKAATP